MTFHSSITGVLSPSDISLQVISLSPLSAKLFADAFILAISKINTIQIQFCMLFPRASPIFVRQDVVPSKTTRWV